MKKTLLLFISIATLMVSSLMAQTNLVPNGGFEQDTWVDGTQPQEWIFNNGEQQTEFWTCEATSGYENPTGIIPAEGSKMGYIKCLTATTYAWQTIKKPEANCVKIKNGDKYIFKFKAYSVLGSGNTATPKIKTYIEEKGNSWTTIDKTVYDIVSGAWQSVSVSFTFLDSSIPVGTIVDVSLGFLLTGNEINTVFFLDDVQIIADESTSFHDSKMSSVKLYPNPILDRCKINGDYQIAKVYNLTGMMVANINNDGRNEIDFSSLPTGYYMVKLEGNTSATLKVLKR